MKLIRAILFGVFLITFNSCYSQVGKGGNKDRFCRICIGSGVFANYIFKTQIDGGINYLVYTAGYANNRGMRRIGKPVAVHRLFLRLGAEYNFKRPIIALKVGIGYQPFKNLYTQKPKSDIATTNRFTKFLLKSLGSMEAAFNFLPYIKEEFKTYSLRPEIGLEIPVIYRLVYKQIVVKPLSFRVNYGYNFYKDKIVPESMNTHFFSVGLIWKMDLARY
ncbi:MAG: hypothetical protein HRT57_10845 [Crocinitomicaceae bacterium]|nr:hypothetical protein [Crocinitomicaceae bacterium]